MADDLIVIQEGIREKTYLLHGPDKHSYYFNRALKGRKLYYRCHLYYKRRCRGTCTVDPNSGSFQRCGRHTHQPEQFLIHERRLRHAILLRCRTGDLEHFKRIYHQERLRLQTPLGALANIPYCSLRPSMERARQEGIPEIPHSLSQLGHILRCPGNEFLTQTMDEEDSIFGGIVGNTQARTRCVILISKRARRYMATVKRIFTDATFAQPNNLGCCQIWNIVTTRRKSNPHIIHLVSVLMQSRTTLAYSTALHAIKRLVPGFCPTEILSDFEQSELAALHEHFTCQIRGCFFHHTKAVCEKVKELGFTCLVRASPTADSIIWSLCAIPLLRKEHILEGFLSVLQRTEESNLQELAPVLNYYQRTWLIPSRMRSLSVHGSLYRTTNVAESFNATLRSTLKRRHPNVYQLLYAFVEIEDITNKDLQVLEMGGTVSRHRNASALMNDLRIKNLTSDLDDREISINEFLRGASRQIQGIYQNILH